MHGVVAREGGVRGARVPRAHRSWHHYIVRSDSPPVLALQEIALALDGVTRARDARRPRPCRAG